VLDCARFARKTYARKAKSR